MFDNSILQPDAMVNWCDPINQHHQLNNGLVADYSIIAAGSSKIRDLTGRYPGTPLSGVSWSAGRNGNRGLGFNGTSSAIVNCGRMESIMTAGAAFTISLFLCRRSNVIGGLVNARNASVASWATGYHTTGQVFMYTTGFVNSAVYAPLNNWVHIAITNNGSTQKFYANGKLMTTSTGSTPPVGGLPSFISLGAWDSGGSAPPNCIMDSVLIHNIALLDGEISELYSEVSSGNPNRWNWTQSYRLSDVVGGGGGGGGGAVLSPMLYHLIFGACR